MQLTKLVQNHAFSGLIVVLLVTMITVFANNPDPDLEQRVSDLEKRVAVIEETLSGTDTIDPPDKEKPYRENWRKLQEGMPQDKVRELLGRPERVDGGSLTTWEYPMGGRVYFMRGKVHSWSEPH